MYVCIGNIVGVLILLGLIFAVSKFCVIHESKN